MNIGDKVVGIYAEKNMEQAEAIRKTFEFKGEYPQIGKVYVVRRLTEHTNGQKGIQLIGSTIIHKPTGRETSFVRECFKKLDEMKASQAESQPKSSNKTI